MCFSVMFDSIFIHPFIYLYLCIFHLCPKVPDCIQYMKLIKHHKTNKIKHHKQNEYLFLYILNLGSKNWFHHRLHSDSCFDLYVFLYFSQIQIHFLETYCLWMLCTGHLYYDIDWLLWLEWHSFPSILTVSLSKGFIYPLRLALCGVPENSNLTLDIRQLVSVVY